MKFINNKNKMELLKLLKVFISKDIANVVQKYFYLNEPLEEENYMKAQNNDMKSFESGNINIIKLMMHKGDDDFDSGLSYASCYGYIKIVDLMIENGADNWNDGLYYACLSGYVEIVELMIQKGANNWNDGLWRACIRGHTEIVKLMIDKGANNRMFRNYK